MSPTLFIGKTLFLSSEMLLYTFKDYFLWHVVIFCLEFVVLSAVMLKSNLDELTGPELPLLVRALSFQLSGHRKAYSWLTTVTTVRFGQ